jgi:hypothetical protein
MTIIAALLAATLLYPLAPAQAQIFSTQPGISGCGPLDITRPLKEVILLVQINKEHREKPDGEPRDSLARLGMQYYGDFKRTGPTSFSIPSLHEKLSQILPPDKFKVLCVEFDQSLIDLHVTWGFAGSMRIFYQEK